MKSSKPGTPKAAPAKIEAPAKPVFKMPNGELMSPPDDSEELDSGDVEEVLTLDAGDAFTAQYRGYKKVRGKDTDNRLHAFLFADGIRRGVYGTMQLNSTLEKVSTGDMVWIGYEGKRTLANGNEMHSFRVHRTHTAAEVANKTLEDLPF